MFSSPVIFKASCVKTLSAVEAHPERSNQHEFNGVQALKHLFGLAGFSRNAFFSVRGSAVSCVAGVTWYDARESHPTRTEHRLYFKTNPVMDLAEEGDNIILGFDRADNLHCVLIKSGNIDHMGVVSGWRSLPN
ncbi:type II restriction endonuclease [Massilia sp.]|uniref:type II restriction endonuclease n=1 Tax=Massilia sp. TaxID=1882437 RepID=UPI00289C1639|nr:type II restriction endonuclease [Massilia sp.]